MNDEQLLQALGKFVKEGDRAASDASVRVPEPLSQEARAQAAESALAAFRRVAMRVSPGVPLDEEPAAVRVERRARSPKRHAAWMGACAIAAALALAYVGRESRPALGPPAYTLEWSGHYEGTRGVGKGTARSSEEVPIGDRTRLRLVLRPAVATSLEVEARVFAIDTSGRAVAWPAQVERAPSGALRLTLDVPPLEIRKLRFARVVVGSTRAIAHGELNSEEHAPSGDVRRYDLHLRAHQ